MIKLPTPTNDNDKDNKNLRPVQTSNFLINRQTGVYHKWTLELAMGRNNEGQLILEPYELPGTPKFKPVTLPIPVSEIVETLAKDIFNKHDSLVRKGEILAYIKKTYNEDIMPDEYTKEQLFLKIYQLRQELDE
jgi:hypothetical protein